MYRLEELGHLGPEFADLVGCEDCRHHREAVALEFGTRPRPNVARVVFEDRCAAESGCQDERYGFAVNHIFSNARRTMMVAIVWSALDVVLHIVVDSVEWQRISGNLVVIAAGLASQAIVSGRTNAGLAALAAVVTIVLNTAWMISEGAAPPIAVILITVALALLFVAGRQFWTDADSSSPVK